MHQQDALSTKLAGSDTSSTPRRLLLAVDTPASGAELWLTDGTPNGMVMVADVAPGPASSLQAFPFGLTGIGGPLGDALLFGAGDGVHGREPWLLPLPGTRTPLRRYGPRRFGCGDPVLGALWSLQCRGLAANEVGLVVVGLPGPPLLLAPQRAVHIDPAGAFVVAIAVPLPDGSWNGSYAIPLAPFAVGFELVVQPVFLPTSPALGIDVGDAYWLSLGF